MSMYMAYNNAKGKLTECPGSISHWSKCKFSVFFRGSLNYSSMKCWNTQAPPGNPISDTAAAIKQYALKSTLFFNKGNPQRNAN